MPRVLVVDDEESIRSLLREYLEGLGVEVFDAADGEAAQKVLNAERLDCVLIDFLLPRKNGFALAEQIRKTAGLEELPIIMMSGVFKNPKTAVEAREKYQVIDFLAKPLDLDRLRELVFGGGRATDDSGEMSLSLEDSSEEVAVMPSLDRIATGGGMPAVMPRGTTGDLPPALPKRRSLPAKEAPRSFPKMPESGELSEVPVALLLSIVRIDHLTGMLDLSDSEGIHRRIYMTGGQPIFMQSNAQGENVGALLLRRGRITEPDFERCLEYMRQKKRTLQQSLLELRLATEQDLATAYKLLAGQLLPSAIGMAQGKFRWQETDAFIGRIPEGRFDAVQVLFEGIKRHVHPPQILRFFENKEDLPLKKTALFDALLPQFRRTFSLDNVGAAVSDGVTYRDLVRSKSKDSGTVLPQVFALVTSGMLNVPEASEENYLDQAVNRAAASAASVAQSSFDEESSAEIQFAEEEEQTSSYSPDDRRAQTKIMVAHEEFLRKNFYEILDLPVAKTIDAERAKQNYLALVRKWHTDAFAGFELGRAKRPLDELFARITEAYETLTNDASRSEYFVYLDRQSKGLPTDIEQVFRAERTFDEGVAAMRRKDFTTARSKIEEAIRLNPGEPLFAAHLGWCKYLADPKSQPVVLEAVHGIKQSIEQQENLPVAYQFLGQICLNNGEEQQALTWFKKCLEFDPKNIESQRGLRLIKSRTSVPPGSSGAKSGPGSKPSGGILSRFLKK